MEPVTHINHPTILNALCYFELFRRLGFMEKDLSFVVSDASASSDSGSAVWVKIVLKTQGSLLSVTTGRWRRQDREALGGEPLELLEKTHAHYQAHADRSGPLYAWWTVGEFEATKARFIRKRCADSAIFVPPNTLKVDL